MPTDTDKDLKGLGIVHTPVVDGLDLCVTVRLISRFSSSNVHLLITAFSHMQQMAYTMPAIGNLCSLVRP